MLFVYKQCGESAYLKGKIKMKYDYLVVGAGLFGATFAHEANRKRVKSSCCG